MTDSWNSQIAGMRSLLSDLSEVPGRPGDACNAMLENLDLFVSDELDGVDVRLRHPSLWRHLQVCASCRQEHDGLLDLMTAQDKANLPELPPRRVTSQPSFGDPWHMRVEALPGRPGPSLLFLFAPDYLRQSFRPAVASGKRGRGLRDRPQLATNTLLLSYLGETEVGEVMIQLYARPDADDPDSCLLSVVAVGEPMPGAVALTWAGQLWEATLGPDGDAQLGPVPLGALSGPDLSPESFSLRLLP